MHIQSHVYRLTVKVQQVLVVTDFSHIARGHGVGGEDGAAHVGGPQVIGAESLLLGFAVWRVSPGLVCSDNSNTVKNMK